MKQSLILQLKNKGADVEHFSDMINDYISFWDIKSKLQKDIKTRGICYRDKSSTGVEIQKNNPSIKELVAVNRQMLAILKDLGLNTNSVASQENDEL